MRPHPELQANSVTYSNWKPLLFSGSTDNFLLHSVRKNWNFLMSRGNESNEKGKLNVVNKTAASVTQLANCPLLHAYSCTATAPRKSGQNFYFA